MFKDLRSVPISYYILEQLRAANNDYILIEFLFFYYYSISHLSMAYQEKQQIHQ